MGAEILLVIVAFLGGRWTAPEIVTTVQVKVEVPIECRETVPARPVMPTEILAERTTPPKVDQWSRAMRVEQPLREAYETELRAALVKCTDPIPLPKESP